MRGSVETDMLSSPLSTIELRAAHRKDLEEPGFLDEGDPPGRAVRHRGNDGPAAVDAHVDDPETNLRRPSETDTQAEGATRSVRDMVLAVEARAHQPAGLAVPALVERAEEPHCNRRRTRGGRHGAAGRGTVAAHGGDEQGHRGSDECDSDVHAASLDGGTENRLRAH